MKVVKSEKGNRDNTNSRTGKKVAPEWLQKIREKVVQDKNKRAEEKRKLYQEKLQELSDLYFQLHSTDEEENKIAFNQLNKEWKKISVKVNATQSLINLQHTAFEEAVAAIMATEEFKTWMEAKK